jgi:hypothetical protein
MMPGRIQRKRAKGWQMPLGVVYCGRPTIYGNPFKGPDGVERFRQYLAERPLLREKMKRELRGKTLACWCAEDVECHVDVILEIVNG